MGEYERSERIGADIERTANTVNPRLPPIEPEPDEPKIEDGEEKRPIRADDDTGFTTSAVPA